MPFFKIILCTLLLNATIFADYKLTYSSVEEGSHKSTISLEFLLKEIITAERVTLDVSLVKKVLKDKSVTKERVKGLSIVVANNSIVIKTEKRVIGNVQKGNLVSNGELKTIDDQVKFNVATLILHIVPVFKPQSKYRPKQKVYSLGTTKTVNSSLLCWYRFTMDSYNKSNKVYSGSTNEFATTQDFDDKGRYGTTGYSASILIKKNCILPLFLKGVRRSSVYFDKKLSTETWIVELQKNGFNSTLVN